MTDALKGRIVDVQLLQVGPGDVVVLTPEDENDNRLHEHLGTICQRMQRQTGAEWVVGSRRVKISIVTKQEVTNGES